MSMYEGASKLVDIASSIVNKLRTVRKVKVIIKRSNVKELNVDLFYLSSKKMRLVIELPPDSAVDAQTIALEVLAYGRSAFARFRPVLSELLCLVIAVALSALVSMLVLPKYITFLLYTLC